TSPGSSRNSSSGGYSSCSTPEEVDVVAFTPRPEPVNEDDQKRYFCQRCLNHAEEHPRKGHKPFCQHVIDVRLPKDLKNPLSYANCECADCHMVEERRRLNNMLSLRRLDPNHHAASRSATGKKIRDPKCALCSAHGDKQPLRGHKKAQCPFLKCGCHLCGLVENRRTLMARQIKLRRDQQKQRKAQLNAAAAALAATTNIATKSLILEQSNSEVEQEQLTTSDDNVKVEEPVRVPPLLPVFPKPQVIEPRPPIPIIFQPTAILPTAPMFISPMDNIDLRLISLNYHHMMNPVPFQFTPMLPYTPTLPFLSAP
ncbi:DM DNA binding domain-containing protein, partial [Wuchereria bancrofti]